MTLSVETYLRWLRDIVESLATHGLYQTIARAHGLTVTVCHYPPGASKWNPVERRLFSFISLEWAGHPLRSLATMMSDIENTTTKTGLNVTAFVNERKYDIQCSMTCSKRFSYSAIRNYQH